MENAKRNIIKFIIIMLFIIEIVNSTFLFVMYNLKITKVTESNVEITIFNNTYNYEYLK